MIEVFVFGVFVAYVKLGDLVTIGLRHRRLRAAGADFRADLGWIWRSTARRCGSGWTSVT